MQYISMDLILIKKKKESLLNGIVEKLAKFECLNVR